MSDSRERFILAHEHCDGLCSEPLCPQKADRLRNHRLNAELVGDETADLDIEGREERYDQCKTNRVTS